MLMGSCTCVDQVSEKGVTCLYPSLARGKYKARWVF